MMRFFGSSKTPPPSQSASEPVTVDLKGYHEGEEDTKPPPVEAPSLELEESPETEIAADETTPILPEGSANKSRAVTFSSADANGSRRGPGKEVVVGFSVALILVLVAFALAGNHAAHSPFSDDDDDAYFVKNRDTAVPENFDWSEAEDVSHIRTRPCRAYVHAPYTVTIPAANDNEEPTVIKKAGRSKVRILQTSLADPSAPWSEMSCEHIDTTPMPPIEEPSSKGWKWLLKLETEKEEREELKRLKREAELRDRLGLDAAAVLLGQVDPDSFRYAQPSAHIQLQYDDGPTFPKREPILGFGGAFTEAAALNYNSLSPEGQKVATELLFGENGLGYSLGRVHMNSCDFCVSSYAFDEVDGDFELNSFDNEVTHDVESGMIGMMVEANKVVKASWNMSALEQEGKPGGMRIILSPWSPPRWMKQRVISRNQEEEVAETPAEGPSSNATVAEVEIDPTFHPTAMPTFDYPDDMTGSAGPTCLKEGAGPDSPYAQAWALYFHKFIAAYKRMGVDLYGLTPQNEPEFPAPWEACSHTPETQNDFLTYHLGPMIREHHPEMKILYFDHNHDHMNNWGNTILKGSALPFVDGVAIHWYAGGMDRLLDGAQGVPNVHRYLGTLNAMGQNTDDHIILGSEACHCPSTGYGGGDINIAWARAERYAHAILADLSAGSNGWIEWNLILDSVGGPNHLGNLCDSPILAVPHRAIGGEHIPPHLSWEEHANADTVVVGDGRTREELHAMGTPAEYLDVGIAVQPIYWYMGHISRHVRPGSRAVFGLVDASRDANNTRTFRPAGQVVAGGGINGLARNGMEITTWPCEGSTRQEWKYNSAGQLQVFGHNWLGVPTTSCVSSVADVSFEGVLLTDCQEGSAGSFTMTEGDTKIVIRNNGENNGKCLVLKPLENGGGSNGPRGGAQVSIGSCEDDAAVWTFDESTGEILSRIYDEGDVCMTTGWPFLQVGAFATPNEETPNVVIIHNEASEPANFVLRDGEDDVILTGSCPAHSIQTVLFD